MPTAPSAETVSTDEIRRLRRSRAIDTAIARLAERQHGVVARRQLVKLGLGERGVDHRIASGRLHPVVPGVYAVGHRRIALTGRWMAATLAAGSEAVLSHRSAAALWGIRGSTGGPVHLTAPRKGTSSRQVRRHCSTLPDDEQAVCEGIPVTRVPRTIFDLAGTNAVDEVERMIREAEFRRLHDSLSLLDLIERYPGRRGVGRVRTALTRIEAMPRGRSRSPLETRFLPFLPDRRAGQLAGARHSLGLQRGSHSRPPPARGGLRGDPHLLGAARRRTGGARGGPSPPPRLRSLNYRCT